MKDVFVERQGEDVVNLLCQVDLRHLQFGQIICHHCVLEVGVHHLFKKEHILARELTQGLVEQVADLWVGILITIDDALNIGLAIR